MNPLSLTNFESDHNDQAVITNKNMYVKRSNCTELLYTSCMYRFKEICTVHESWHAQTAAVQVRLRNENWGHKQVCNNNRVITCDAFNSVTTTSARSDKTY